MKKEFDFENSKPNPYAERLRKPVTMNMDVKVIDYFKRESERTGIPCQNIINMHLLQCVEEQKHVKLV